MRTYTQYVQYFEDVAANHIDIQHNPTNKRFFPIDLADFVNSLKSFGQMPALALERPIWQTSGNFANIRLRKTGALLIIDRVNDPYDFAAIETAYSKCFDICNDIRAKMVKDAKLWDENLLDYTLPGLDPSSFTLEPAPPGFIPEGGLYAVRLSFSFDEGAEHFNPDKWAVTELDYDHDFNPEP